MNTGNFDAESYQKIMNANNGWQPIETAPKDGLILMSFYYTNDTFPTEQFTQITYWSDSEKGWDGIATSIRLGAITPTHWMPLPKPPAL